MMLDDDLRPSLAASNVCAFAGAGLSIGAGLPGWYDLIAELTARIGYKLAPREWATGDALIDAAQAYVNRQGLHSLISHLKDWLDTTGKQPTAAHRALARLPISLVFTANFDDLLERAFRDAGKRVEVVVRDSSIPFMRRGPDTVNIVKLYGDLDQPDTIVVARQQYESYFLQRPQMVKLLEIELARSDTLYLGWSGADPYFKLVFGELLSRFGPMMRPGYAVMFDVTGAQRDELARKQIRLVELPAGDRTAQLAAWLEGLAPPAVQSITPASVDRKADEQAGHPRLSASVPVPFLGQSTSGKGKGGPAESPLPVLNTGKAWAVLVGVNQYENQPHIPALHVCADDVTAVHAALVGKFTAARLLTDATPERLPTRANILAELSSVAQAAGEGDLVLFYFSGHGIAEDGESYLLPRDARLAALTYTSVAMAEVRKIIDASPARAKVIVLDACHSGAAIGKAGPAMTPEFIERVFAQAEGLATLASCKQGQQSWEWPEEGRSVFTHFVLEALSGKADFDGKGFVTVSDASRYVTDGVKTWAVEHGVPQTPTLQYTAAGDIILVRYTKGPEQPDLRRRPHSAGYRQHLAKWLEAYHFSTNPFASWEADKERAVLPWLLVDRSYVTTVLGDPTRPVNSFLLAARGAGKSAAREAVQHKCISGRVHALPVRYTDFTALLRKAEGDPTKINPRDHVEAILRAGLRALADDVAPPSLDQLSEGDRALLQSMAEAFADPIAQQKLALSAPAAVSQIRWERFEPSEALDAFASLVTRLGWSKRRRYESLYVLVDRVDETLAGAAGALPLLRPLIFEGGLLDIPHIAFKFFLPVEIGEQLLADAAVRRDRCIVESITWDCSLLMQMIQVRLLHYSDGNIQDLEQVCSTAARALVPRLWRECNSSPRDLLQLCGRILRFHAERTDEAFLEPIDITSSLHEVKQP